MMQGLALSGLKAVELHAIGPIPFVGMQLQTLGASVTRIVPPHERGIGLSIDERSDLMNAEKSVIALDLKTSAGREVLNDLLSESDVLLEGFRPGVLERLQLSPKRLLEAHPTLIIGRLSGYGRRGAYASLAGHDINYLALSGVLAAIGTPERPIIPLNLIADFGGGAMHLLMGVLASLVRRGIDGQGGVVDTSILAGTIGLTSMFHGLLAGDYWDLGRELNLLDGGAPFYRVYEAADKRFVAVGALEARFFAELLELLGLQETIDARRQHDRSTWLAMGECFATAFQSQSMQHWAQAALGRDCCVTPVLDFHEALALESHRENGWVNDEPFPHPGPLVSFE